ncbi:hypothetical protein ACJ41O_012412 [Fusarium nematophilum]
MDRNQDRGAIAHNVQAVLKSFQNLTASFAESSSQQPGATDLRELLPGFENEVTRFKMWAGNLAAHQSGPASLDHRLREAPHLQEQVVYLLSDISESLEDTMALLIPHMDSPETSENVQDEPASSEGSADRISENDFTDSDLDGDEDVSLEAGLSTLCTDIGEAIDCLLRLSVAIANPVPHERFRKLGAGPSEDVSFYEEHDIRYVRDKFPKSDKSLSGALGKFITRRRQFFKYREAHHAKLAAGLDQENQKDTSRTELVPKTVASSLPEHLKKTGVIDEDNRSDMAMSETSYATSAGFLMQEDGQIKPAPPLKVPPPPAEAEKGAFECPFCYRMISAGTRRAWKRHVFGDLRPYTCLFSRCIESNTDFDRRHRWQLHLSQYHWRTWSCPFKCGHMFPSAVELENHVRHQHLPNAGDGQLSTVVARGEVSVSDDISKECPLCGHAASGLKSYLKHVGRHLEQLALFALPNIEDDELEDDLDSDEQNDVASRLDAESTDNGSMASSQALGKPESGETDGRLGIEVLSGRKGSDREQQGDQHLRERIDVVLKDANIASLLHNDEDFEGAREAYVKASDSIQQILQEVSYGEKRSLLESIQRSYISSIKILDQEISEAASRREAEEAFSRRTEALINAQQEAKKELEKAKVEAGKAARERLENERKADEKQARNHAQAMKRAEEHTRLRFEAESRAAEALRKADEDARTNAVEEAQEKFEHATKATAAALQAESEAAEGRGGKGAEQRVGADMKTQEDREHAEELAPIRPQKATPAETGANTVTEMDAQREADRLMQADQELEASEKALLPVVTDGDSKPVAQDTRPTYTRFSRKYLSIETLRAFGVDFGLDTDPEYLLIKRWVPEREQDRMWKHTRNIREQRRNLIIGSPPTDRAVAEPGLKEGISEETSRENHHLRDDWNEQELERARHELDAIKRRQAQDEEEERIKEEMELKRLQEDDEAYKEKESREQEAAEAVERYLQEESSRVAKTRASMEARDQEHQHQKRLSPTLSFLSASKDLRPEILGVQHEPFAEANAREFDRLERSDASNHVDGGDDRIEESIAKERLRQDQEDAAERREQQKWDAISLEKEYHERLEADLRRSGLGEVEIKAILKKEKIKSHPEVWKGKVPEALTGTDIGEEAGYQGAQP